MIAVVELAGVAWPLRSEPGHRRLPLAAAVAFGAGFGGVCYMRATPIQRRCQIKSAYNGESKFKNWSGARDLNPGPHGPEPCALPNCASPRHLPSELGDSTEEFAYRSVVEAFGEVDNSA